jgi:type I restriction-modification system DNA methylase subunit
MTKQVKSKKRVAEHGEVFTAEREVKAMCDLVKQETERIDSRFLEPACGNGNFLAEILSRKLAVVSKLATPQQEKEVIKIKCRSCGTLNDEDAKFCKECGKEI